MVTTTIHERIKHFVYSFPFRSGMLVGETRLGDALDGSVPRCDYAVYVGRKLYMCRVGRVHSKLARIQ